jgi:hypothetical protein
MPLEMYVDTSIVNFAVELEEDDCSDMDLTVYNNFEWSFLAKRGGTVIDSFDLNSGITRLSNVITLNQSLARSMIYRKGLTYYHQLTATYASGGEKEVLLFGSLDAI